MLNSQLFSKLVVCCASRAMEAFPNMKLIFTNMIATIEASADDDTLQKKGVIWASSEVATVFS